ncbi:NHL domain-containing thioredoxin family protein [Aquipuribacter hungaricus]|uniref:NHL domain-containing thioredoxin family protein n=1 Tax=Aquipuribacter hungaricus TaxID=545624 RepID=UPI00360D9522
MTTSTRPAAGPAAGAPSLRGARVRAPELAGRGWLGTGGEQRSLAGLRGRIVLLDFWTFCCVNCLHVLDELREVEAEFADVLVVVGVHSPKFEHEADPVALADAVERYEVHHPVLDDPELLTWQAYAARAWPTLAVVDPEGYVVAQLSGEGHAPGLRTLLRELVAEHEARGTLRRGDGPYVPPAPSATTLRFPGKVLPLRAADGCTTLLVTDSSRHRLVELAADGETVLRTLGTGERGLVDGSPATARFAEPQGLALLPPDVAARVGYDVVVADTASHALRGLRLSDGHVVTVAGTGEQLRQRAGGGPATAQPLSTPWDVAWFDGQVVVAMAGLHQLWAFDPAPDPADGVVRLLAGTSAEGVRDGAGEQAWFAQPSGLAVSADGRRLWVADSETSALRWLERADADNAPAGPATPGADGTPSVDGTPAVDEPAPDRSTPVVTDTRLANAAPAARPGYTVGTAVGEGLFDFGHVDGPAASARLQHPLGVGVLADGSVAVADTYNGAVRRYDPVADEVSTLARDLAEPSDVVLDPDDPSLLLVVASAAHEVVRLRLPARASRVDTGEQRTQRPPTLLAAGPVRLTVAFRPPTGQKLDDRWGDPTRLTVSSTPPGLLRAGDGGSPGLVRDLELVGGAGTTGVLHVSVQAASCDGDPVTGEVPEHAACHLYQQDWGIPVVLDGTGAARLDLDLRGVG